MCDVDLGQITLILEFDLDLVKMYRHTKNEVSASNASKVIAQTHRQTQTKILPTHMGGNN